MNGFAYVADGDQGLRIIDVSKPSAAMEISHFIPRGKRVDVRDVEIVGSHAYLASGSSGLTVIDISDPKNLREVAQGAVKRTARNVRVSGANAYVADLDWLRVFDISNPILIREMASYKIPATLADIWVDESGVYAAANEAGLMILGLKNASVVN